MCDENDVVFVDGESDTTPPNVVSYALIKLVPTRIKVTTALVHVMTRICWNCCTVWALELVELALAVAVAEPPPRTCT